MSSITIKNIPVELHRSLKDRALANGRSLNQEIIHSLKNQVGAGRIKKSNLVERSREVRESMGIYLTEKDLNQMKSTGRS